jgi:two-component system KDP operon response regulator KdpE
MMPEMDGWHVCRHLRRFTDVPVIMLTVLDRHRDVVRSLDSGADYYLTKPFSPAVLLERSRAALRRNENAAVRRAATGRGVGERNPVIYSDAYLTIDVDQRCALADGKPIQLSRIESRLLAYLLQNAPRILHFDQILENVWGDVQQSHTDNLHICMWHLRQKLERDPGQPEYLLNEYGVGYSFQIKVGLTEFA